jgi:hypothetical protein
LFVDDSGTREYSHDRQYGPDRKTGYIVYGAILISERNSSLCASRVQELKTLRLGTTDVEIKSDWLRISKERENRYLRPLNRTDAQLATFTESTTGYSWPPTFNFLAPSWTSPKFKQFCT